MLIAVIKPIGAAGKTLIIIVDQRWVARSACGSRTDTCEAGAVANRTDGIDSVAEITIMAAICTAAAVPESLRAGEAARLAATCAAWADAGFALLGCGVRVITWRAGRWTGVVVVEKVGKARETLGRICTCEAWWGTALAVFETGICDFIVVCRTRGEAGHIRHVVDINWAIGYAGVA